MGSALQHPVTAKESEDGSCVEKGLAWGACSMQGWRISMEDAHFAIPSLEGDGWQGTALFGVLDGHGGDLVARFCETRLPKEIAKGPCSDPKNSLVNAFHRMDDMLCEPSGLAELERLAMMGTNGQTPQSRSLYGSDPSWIGCTAVVCCVRPDVIVVANAGDSRAILCREGQAVPMSDDHKPNMPAERARISKAGGTVERQQVGPVVQYRVNGNLNLSRSIGDLQYKQNTFAGPEEQMICSTPDVLTFEREPRDEFMVLACDGIWDVLANQDVVDFIRERLPRCTDSSSTEPLSRILEELLDACISPNLALTAGLGGDNMTAVLVVFNHDSATRASDPDDEAQHLDKPANEHEAAGSKQSSVSSRPQPCEGLSGGHQNYDLDSAVVVPSGLFCGCTR